MSKKKDYLFNITPRWILYSGLPKQLNKEYGPCAWSIFHCLIQADCRFNPNYCDTFDQLFEEIAELTGTTRQTVSKYIKLFEMDGLLSVERGKFTGQKTTFELVNPIKTPKSPKDIHALKGGLLNRKGKQPNLRYAEQVKDVYPLQRSNMSKIHSEQVKDREKQVKGVYYNKRKEEEKRRKKENVNQAQAISSFQKEEIRLLTREQVRERSRAFLKELREKTERKEKEKWRKKQPEMERRKKALLKQTQRLIKDEQKSDSKTEGNHSHKT